MPATQEEKDAFLSKNYSIKILVIDNEKQEVMTDLTYPKLSYINTVKVEKALSEALVKLGEERIAYFMS
jgi:hypothetical protein